MSNLSVFQFESQEVRFVNGKPVANDVAKVLGYKDPSNAVSRLVKPKNKGVCDLQTPGGTQSVTVLEEPGIYQLIFSSKLEAAEMFQDWVFEEVLPAIRKTGKFESASAQSKYLPPSQEVASLALMLGEYAGMDKPLTAQLAVNAAVAVNPALKPAADTIKVAIACSAPSEDASTNQPTTMYTLEDKIVNTRKPHICWGCQKKFESGSLMRLIKNACDGNVATSYLCEHCDRASANFTADDWELTFPGDIGYWKNGQWFPSHADY